MPKFLALAALALALAFPQMASTAPVNGPKISRPQVHL